MCGCLTFDPGVSYAGSPWPIWTKFKGQVIRQSSRWQCIKMFLLSAIYKCTFGRRWGYLPGLSASEVTTLWRYTNIFIIIIIIIIIIITRWRMLVDCGALSTKAVSVTYSECFLVHSPVVVWWIKIIKTSGARRGVYCAEWMKDGVC